MDHRAAHKGLYLAEARHHTDESPKSREPILPINPLSLLLIHLSEDAPALRLGAVASQIPHTVTCQGKGCRREGEEDEGEKDFPLSHCHFGLASASCAQDTLIATLLPALPGGLVPGAGCSGRVVVLGRLPIPHLTHLSLQAQTLPSRQGRAPNSVSCYFEIGQHLPGLESWFCHLPKGRAVDKSQVKKS